MNEAQAEDEILGMLWTAWRAGAATAAEVATVPAMLWDDQDGSVPPDGVPYGRANFRHVGGRQASLWDQEGRRHYARTGLLTVQCFGPRDRGKAVARALALVAKDAFEGKHSPSGAWFRNCRTQEIGPDAGWYQVNAVVEFEYADRK